MADMGTCVVAVDIGSVGPPPAFSWASFDVPARKVRLSGSDPQTAVSALVAGLAWGGRAALLLQSLRPAHVDRGVWMLRQLASALPGLSATTQPGLWQSGGAQLMLAQAFVRGSGTQARPPAGHDPADAADAAGLALVELLADGKPLTSRVRRSPPGSFNQLTAMGLWAGLSIDPAELNQGVLVIAAGPQVGQ